MTGSCGPLGYKVDKLLKGTLSPLCGMNQEIGFFSRSSSDPKLITTGVELTGVHHLLKRPDPGKGGYHIGGMGIFRNEALIKALGESAERYSQLISCFHMRDQYPTLFTSYASIEKRGEPVIPKKYLSLFSQEQLGQPGFVFDLFTEEKPISWIQLPSLLDGQKYWIPQQMLFVGFNLHKQKGEPWLYCAVTTGTAVHDNYPAAIRNALLEMIQIDSAMGHWYGNTQALEIAFDGRTKMIERVLQKYGSAQGVKPKFYWLPNADLPGACVACLIYDPQGIPRTVVGLGADTELENAMYKAYLEAAGIVNLARLTLFREKYSEKGAPGEKQMFDLDSNISYYAKGNGVERIHQKFLSAPKIAASKLPADINPGKELISSFLNTKKPLFFIDLTSVELKELGLVSTRLWTPDTISLCLPSAPYRQHPRFEQYGGISHADPHPYP